MGRITLTFDEDNFTSLLTMAYGGIRQSLLSIKHGHIPERGSKQLKKIVDEALDALLEDIVFESDVDEQTKLAIIVATAYATAEEGSRLRRDVERVITKDDDKRRRDGLFEFLKKEFGGLDDEE